MKNPSRNMSKSLRGQSPGGRGAEAVRVSKQSPYTAAGMTIPGEGMVEDPPGMAPARSAKDFAKAVGRHFGG